MKMSLMLIYMSITKQRIKFSQHFIYLTEWFRQQTEFTTDFETMEVNEMSKCPGERLSIAIWGHRLTTKTFPSSMTTCWSVKPIRP